MNRLPINFTEKLSRLTDLWSPRTIARLNDNHFKLVKIKGDFVWHSHPETDEAFIVLSGSLSIHFRDGRVALNTGEMYVVPRGTEHKPFAEEECHILLVEPASTKNTGDAGGPRTAPSDQWI